ncbi:MAG: Chromosome partition protein Smc, partial [Parcubacteria group bacterium GW2011_GWE2_37_8]
KLELTKNNLIQAGSLITEIGPHLKFLKRQSEKIQQKEILEKNLRENEQKYFQAKLAVLAKEKDIILKSKEDVDRIIAEESGTMSALKDIINKDEEQLESFFDQESILEKELEEIIAKKSSLERELGKIEGILAYRQKSPENIYEAVDLSYLNNILKGINQRVGEAILAASIEEMREKLKSVLADFDKVLEEIKSGKIKKWGDISGKEKPEEIIQEPLFIEKEKLTDLLNDLENQIKSVRERIKELNNSHRSQKDKLYAAKKELYERESHHGKLKEQSQNFNFRFDRILADIELVKQEVKLIENSCDIVIESTALPQSHELDALKNEIERVRMRLEMTDNIDPEIQKEFEETQKRYDFLSRETEDLNKAIVSLNDVVADLEGKIETIFNESFIKINNEFNRYFNMLFDGGKAHLVKISEEKKKSVKDDELEENYDNEEGGESGGIDIKVDMPRKKVKDIHMLSGGERALTSIALIFALVSCSPPPFLMLDEIDAPLDESNALRFGRILEELRAKTQFVVITHNRETMKQADILYGITMGDDGVSKLFSLKLEEAAGIKD